MFDNKKNKYLKFNETIDKLRTVLYSQGIRSVNDILKDSLAGDKNGKKQKSNDKQKKDVE